MIERIVMKKKFIPVLLAALALAVWHRTSMGITMLTKNDPYPLYTTAYPYHYLLFGVTNYFKDITDCVKIDRVSFHVTPFHQKASRGRDFEGCIRFLGDLEGRWNMLGLLYGAVPTGQSLAGTQIGFAKQQIFPPLGPNDTVPVENVLTDTGCHIGYFAVPLKYRKTGVRFELDVQPFEDFGFTIQAGLADIKQTQTCPCCGFIDLTPTVSLDDSIFPAAAVPVIESLLMSCTAATLTFSQIGLETCDFEEDSVEDMRFFVWWRHVFEVNANNCTYPYFLFIPFVQIEATAPIAKTQNRRKAFALPFGNDGHSSVGFTAGFHLDFKETIEIGFFGGYTAFSSRTIDLYRLPTSPVQSGVFPFSTTAKVQPGHNSIFGVLFHAYRFLERLSCWVEYDTIHHTEDKITIENPPANNPFIPRQQECLSKWRVQVLNTAFNYEISPNLTLGLAAQWPITQRNAYRSTTLAGSLIATF